MVRSALPVALLTVGVLAACGSDGAAGRQADPASTTPARTGTTGGGEPARAAQARRGVRLARLASFTSPVYVTAAPGDNRRLYVVEQAGRVMVIRGGHKLDQPFLDIRSQVRSGGEQGLLSIAFAPDFAHSRLFYVYFTSRDGRENVVEFRAASRDRADQGTQREVLRMDAPEPNHNGGLLLFGPDRLMYVGTGDGGGGDDQHGTRGNPQDLGSLLGKILRIDPRVRA